MANPLVADYKVIKKTEIALGETRGLNNFIDIEFDVPRALSTRESAILTFSLIEARRARLTIAVNEKDVYKDFHDLPSFFSILSRAGYRIQEVIDPDFKNRNVISFRISSGQIILSDVVIWFQRERTLLPLQGGVDTTGEITD